MVHLSYLVFFFQAEDGIRDHCVTGVQTCALPIYVRIDRTAACCCSRPRRCCPIYPYIFQKLQYKLEDVAPVSVAAYINHELAVGRSEERRVGEGGVRSGRGRLVKQKGGIREQQRA